MQCKLSEGHFMRVLYSMQQVAVKELGKESGQYLWADWGLLHCGPV